MKKFIIKCAIALNICFFTSVANAALILDNSTNVEALSISESFSSFYDRSGSVQWSSNTGFELADTFVVFLAEFGGNYALIGLVDGTSDVGDLTGGSVDVSIDDDSSVLGSATYIDDPSEAVSIAGGETSISFAWNDGGNDGFVYEIGDINDFDLSIGLESIVGLNDFVFLSLGSIFTPISIGADFTLSSSFVPVHSVDVSSPSAFLILGLVLCGIGYTRRASHAA